MASALVISTENDPPIHATGNGGIDETYYIQKIQDVRICYFNWFWYLVGSAAEMRNLSHYVFAFLVESKTCPKHIQPTHNGNW